MGIAGRCYTQLARIYLRSGGVRDNVENDQLNIERYVTELANLLVDAVQATGKIRMINMVTAINPGGWGGAGGTRFTTKGIMEHRVIMNLRMVHGD